MDNKNKAIISIIAVLMIIVLVVAGTYSYWSWASSNSQKTNISFSVSGDSDKMYANLEGDGLTAVSSLVPAECTSSNAIKKEVVINYANVTNNNAKITADLNMTSFTSGALKPTNTQLESLKWTISRSNTSCTTNVVKSGNFSGFGETIPQVLTNLEINVPANTEAKSETYYLYIWLDSSYSHTNIGNDNTDPMQNLNFKLQWSGTISQVG